MEQNRISATDSVKTMISELSNGNPGAIKALTEVSHELSYVKFQNLALSLDMMKVYGDQIWIEYNELCNNDPNKFYQKIMNNPKDIGSS